MQYIRNAYVLLKILYIVYIYVLQRMGVMKKFKIPSIPPTTNKTIRFPNDVIEKVEDAIQGTNCTFSAFVIAAVKMALEDLEEK